MPILPKDNHCCGCAACFNACSHASIKMVQDDEGFYIPQVDESTCTECKACESVCPTLPFLNFAPYDKVRKISQFPLMPCAQHTDEYGGGGAEFCQILKTSA